MATIDMTKHVNGEALKAFGADILNYEKGITDAVNSVVNTLVGSDANMSVRSIANAELAAQLLSGKADADFKTLQELAAWLEDHPETVAGINAKILALQNITAGIGGEGEKATIVAYVTDVISAAQADITTELAKKVDKVEGKSLIADTEIERLAGMSTGANKAEISAESYIDGTTVATITIDGQTTPIQIPAAEFITEAEAHAIFAELITSVTE